MARRRGSAGGAGRGAAAVLIVATALGAAAGPAAAQTIERVSVDAAGNQLELDASGLWGLSTSADGRHVAFSSFDPFVVPSDTNGRVDVFVRDRGLDLTTRVSVSTGGVEGDGISDWAVLSDDGRFVAFQSRSTDLAPGDTDADTDVYLHDRDADGNGVFDEPSGVLTTLVSAGLAGAEPDGASRFPAISGDGRFVAFASSSSNLVAGDVNGLVDVFVRDVVAGTTTLASVGVGGAPADGPAAFDLPAALSGDGRWVAFVSEAGNLVATDGNGVADVFVRDLVAGETVRVSVSSSGGEGDGPSRAPAISADGRHVAFASRATNLVAADGNGAISDVFTHDRDTDGDGTFDAPGGVATRLASLDVDGGQPTGDSGELGVAISADGRRVAYGTFAADVTACDINGAGDVVVHDRDVSADGVLDEPGDVTTFRVSRGPTGEESFGNSGEASPPALSADGTTVVFESGSEVLVPGDDNLKVDVFAVDLDTAFVDLGKGLAGKYGPPALIGSGTLAAGAPITIRLGCAREFSQAVLIVGLFALDAPLKGGTLVPAPNLTILGIPTGNGPMFGGFGLVGTWPAGVPGGVETFYQVWVTPDPDAPKNYAISNALRAETP